MSNPLKSRIELEHEELGLKHLKLNRFIETSYEFDSLKKESKDVLFEQLEIMKSYMLVLEKRLRIMNNESNKDEDDEKFGNP